MTRQEYSDLCDFLGGEESLLHILKQIAICKDQEPACALAEHLADGGSVFSFFQDDGRPIEDGYKRDAYLVHSYASGELRISYGICYGGLAGTGAEYVFKKENKNWALTDKPDVIGWIH